MSTANGTAASTAAWPDLNSDHPLAKFLAELPTILSDAQHSEMYGVQLEVSSDE